MKKKLQKRLISLMANAWLFFEKINRRHRISKIWSDLIWSKLFLKKKLSTQLYFEKWTDSTFLTYVVFKLTQTSKNSFEDFLFTFEISFILRHPVTKYTGFQIQILTYHFIQSIKEKCSSITEWAKIPKKCTLKLLFLKC